MCKIDSSFTGSVASGVENHDAAVVAVHPIPTQYLTTDKQIKKKNIEENLNQTCNWRVIHDLSFVMLRPTSNAICEPAVYSLREYSQYICFYIVHQVRCPLC